MKKHKHYQVIRAFADGWPIEVKEINGELWHITSNPHFSTTTKYRIVPDEDGWIPWYPHEDAEQPVDGMVDFKTDAAEYPAWKAESVSWSVMGKPFGPVTHYRPHKEKSKRDRIAELLEACCDRNELLEEIMEIVEK